MVEVVEVTEGCLKLELTEPLHFSSFGMPYLLDMFSIQKW
jgi:hypothetical protein